MEILQSQADIAHGMELFKQAILQLGEDTPIVTLGFPSGQFKTSVTWISSLGIWACFGMPPNEKSPGERYWNAFGIGKPVGTVNIGCEINPPISGLNRRTGGAIAKSNFGNLHLVHRGNLNASGRIPNLYIQKHFRAHWIQVEDGDKVSKVIDFGELTSSDFPEQLRDFILEVRRVKNEYRQTL